MIIITMKLFTGFSVGTYCIVFLFLCAGLSECYSLDNFNSWCAYSYTSNPRIPSAIELCHKYCKWSCPLNKPSVDDQRFAWDLLSR